MDTPRKYDYIITGAGCAGLTLAMHLISSKKFGDKKILLIDKDLKKSNDRTWCFWQKEESLFESIVYRQWQKLWFHGEDFSKELNIQPYQYKMIRGIDFYDHCLQEINKQSNIEIRFQSVDEVFSKENETGVIINGEKIYCRYVFNSILFKKPGLTAKQFWLLQHFQGWTIETETNVFSDVATLMDFRIDQKWGTSFCYVLPFSANKALVEYTLFSPKLLQNEQYKEGLKCYIKDVLKINSYKIIDEEFGAIPMTNFKFSSHQNNIINIGTAGGQTKGSSGYTFNFIQKHSKALTDQLIKKENPFINPAQKRFHFYDSVLLNILYNNSLPGKKIFTDLFKNNEIDNVLRFLDNETTIREELKIISSLPTMPFMKAAIKQFF